MWIGLALLVRAKFYKISLSNSKICQKNLVKTFKVVLNFFDRLTKPFVFLNSIMPNGLGVGLGLRFTIDCILYHIVKPVCVSVTIYYRKHSFGAIKGSVMVYKQQFLIIFK